MSEAALQIGVTNHVIRRLIKSGALPATQVVQGAPYQIKRSDLGAESIAIALASKWNPRRDDDPDQISMFPVT